MEEKFGETSIVRTVAKVAARRVTRRTIAVLQGMSETLSGDDSALKTTWDEICAQVQSDESLYWEANDETVRAILKEQVEKLTDHERAAIWMQTDAGLDWRYMDPDEREEWPLLPDDIVDYLAREHVYFEAGRWSNDRIRAYLEHRA